MLKKVILVIAGAIGLALCAGLFYAGYIVYLISQAPF